MKSQRVEDRPSTKALVESYDLAETTIGRLKTVLGNEGITSAGKETLKDIIKDSRRLLNKLDKLNIIEEEAAIAEAALTTPTTTDTEAKAPTSTDAEAGA